MITFKPKQITKKLLATLPNRAKDVLEKRYGLGTDAEAFTLESIGQAYGITRERVRQIEGYGISSIQKSDSYQEYKPIFDELHKLVAELGGGVIAEAHLLDLLSSDQ